VSTPEQVRDYLQLIKYTISHPAAEKGWVLVSRAENNACILQLGLKMRDIEDTFLGLSVEDYCDGPCDDLDAKGEVWIFGKVIDNQAIYIKIKLASLSTLKMVRVISFHFAQRALSYPLRPEEE
jgi:hypothetical protein